MADPIGRDGKLSAGSLRNTADRAEGARRHVVIGNDTFYVTPGGMVLAGPFSTSSSPPPPPGPKVSIENADATNLVSPVSLIICSNFDDTHKFGRILTTPGTAGQAFLDWQGFRAFHAGDGYHGPEPDIEFKDSPSVVWTITDDPTDQRLVVSATSSGTAIQNADGTALTKPVALIVCDNFDDVHKFGRIVTTQAPNNSALLDWQGLRAFHAPEGYHGPEPDLEFSSKLVPGFLPVLWQITDDTANQRLVVEGFVPLVAPPGPPIPPPVPIPPFPPPTYLAWVAAFNAQAPFNVDFPLLSLMANNTLSNGLVNPAFGRIFFSFPAGFNNFITQIDWQGFFVFNATQGYIGPEPDIEIIDGYGLTVNLVDDTVDKRVQINLAVGLSWTELQLAQQVTIPFGFGWVDVMTLPIASPASGATWLLTAQVSAVLNSATPSGYMLFQMVDENGKTLGCPLPCCWVFCGASGIRGSCTLTWITQTSSGVNSKVKLQGQVFGSTGDLGFAMTCTGDSFSGGCVITAARIA